MVEKNKNSKIVLNPPKDSSNFSNLLKDKPAADKPKDPEEGWFGMQNAQPAEPAPPKDQWFPIESFSDIHKFINNTIGIIGKASSSASIGPLKDKLDALKIKLEDIAVRLDPKEPNISKEMLANFENATKSVCKRIQYNAQCYLESKFKW